MLKLIDTALAVTGTLQSLGVNYQQVMAAQERANAEGRELSSDELQAFIDQAQAAVDRL